MGEGGPNMICSLTEQDWQAYMDGTLSRKRMDSLERHLVQCPHCMHIYQHLLANDLGQLEKRYGPHVDLAEIIMQKIELEIQRKPAKRQKNAAPRSIRGTKTWLHYGLAACLALFLLGSGVFNQTVVYTQQSQVLFDETGRWMVESKLKANHWLDSFISGVFNKKIGGKTSHEE